MEKQQHGFAPVEIATGEILIAHASTFEYSAVAAMVAAELDRRKFEVRPIVFSISE